MGHSSTGINPLEHFVLFLVQPKATSTLASFYLPLQQIPLYITYTNCLPFYSSLWWVLGLLSCSINDTAISYGYSEKAGTPIPSTLSSLHLFLHLSKVYASGDYSVLIFHGFTAPLSCLFSLSFLLLFLLLLPHICSLYA